MTSLWTAPPRTEQAKAIYAAAEQDRLQHPERYQLDPGALIDLIERQLGCAIPGPEVWREGLNVYLKSAREDANLNALGIRAASGTMIGRLTARTRIEQWWQNHSASEQGLDAPPIFIIGGWRTGTTFLQRMLHSLPGLRGLYPFELSAPWKAASASTESREKLMQGAQSAHDRLHLLNSRMQQVHDSGADLPEECVLALGTGLKNWGFLSTMGLSTYATWLEQQSLADEYRTYARVLAMLQQQDQARYVLKAPAHTAELEHLLAAFPNALIIHLHRDVVETVASGASLFAVFRSTYCDKVEPREVGQFQAEQTHLWFQRAMKVRRICESEGRGQFLDIAYADLVKQPKFIVRQILEAADIPMSGLIEQSLEVYLTQNRQHKHGSHHYSADEFGLSAPALRDRFKDYRERFNVS